MTIRNRDFSTDIAMGGRTGHSSINKFAYNVDVDTSSPELIAAQGGSINIMTTADSLDVVSSSANDDLGNTGAEVLLISGIDENFLEISEQLVLDGVSPVTTTNSYLGVNRAVVISSGTNQRNVGNITISDNSGTVGTQAYIPADSSVTEQALYHTPINANLLVTWVWANVLKLAGGSSPKVTVKGYSYSRVTDTYYDIFNARIDTSVENTLSVTFGEPFPIGGREVLYFTLETDTNNTDVSFRFSAKQIPTN